MTTQIHYDLLRDRRVTKREEIVLGHRYLLCHVPMDNPYTRGTHPSCEEKRIIDVQFLNYFDLHPATKGRIQDKTAWSILSKKAWMFRTEEKPLYGNKEWVRWHQFSDMGVGGEYSPVNYVLDLDVLEEEGIEVLYITSVPYVISDQLAHDRELERLAEIAFLDYTEKDVDDEQENFTDALEDREPEL